MRKALHIAGIILFGTLPAVAQVGLPWPGPGGVSGTATFTSFGDVQAATAWWSCTFAYSAATRGTKACRLCNGGVCSDVNSDATTGIVANTPTINGAACNNSTHICKIDTKYDKAGTADMVQATDANRPVFVVDGYATGIPCASYTRANSTYLATTSGVASGTNAYIVSGVFKRNTGQSANQNNIFGSNSASGPYFYHDHSADIVDFYGGGVSQLQVTLTDNTWGSVGVVTNGTSSYIRANANTQSGVDPGGQSVTATQNIGRQVDNTTYYDGMICEVGWINNLTTTSVVDLLVANQRSALRYNY
jgi:hypothetical protein